ncbi:MAG TPA: hypothetical protein VFN30_10810 [Chitinophagaceae bacterium]|nr:hypothetical protein [Chitinophagaceae bacterium]
MKKPITLLAFAFFCFTLYLNFFTRTYSTEPVNYVQKKVNTSNLASKEEPNKVENAVTLAQKEPARKEDELVTKGMNKK